MHRNIEFLQEIVKLKVANTLERSQDYKYLPNPACLERIGCVFESSQLCRTVNSVTFFFQICETCAPKSFYPCLA